MHISGAIPTMSILTKVLPNKVSSGQIQSGCTTTSTQTSKMIFFKPGSVPNEDKQVKVRWKFFSNH